MNERRQHAVADLVPSNHSLNLFLCDTIVTSRNANTLLVLLLAVSTAVTFYFTDRKVTGWGFGFLGAIGSNASILGIVYTLYQLYKIREETALIKETSEATKRELFKLENFGDITRGISLIHETQNYLRSTKFELALIKLQELKIIIAENISITAEGDQADELRAEKTNLNLLIASLEKEIESQRSSIRIPKINGSLENIRDLLISLRIDIKSN